MDHGITQILIALVRSAVCDTRLTDKQLSECSGYELSSLVEEAKKQDVEHLLILGLKKNGLVKDSDLKTIKIMHKAVFRYEKLNFEFEMLCSELENAEIPFIPLKGSVLRKYYPEPWMRTSCDIDIFVRREDLEKAILCLKDRLQFEEEKRASHDVSLFSPRGNHVELHFELVEEWRANNANEVLGSVWENVCLHEDKKYRYDMSDAFFYFYHIAHMAKHFETGGCGISPFIDLWILDNLDFADKAGRDELLSKGGLLEFSRVARKLSEVWLGGKEHDEQTLAVQEYVFKGGVYGSIDSYVALQQKKTGGRAGFILSRIFMPYEKMKKYYPILEKHRWLTPAMQVRRWFRLVNPDAMNRAKKEMAANSSVDKTKAEELSVFLESIGLSELNK